MSRGCYKGVIDRKPLIYYKNHIFLHQSEGGAERDISSLRVWSGGRPGPKYSSAVAPMVSGPVRASGVVSGPVRSGRPG